MNVINLSEPYINATMNMLRKHIVKLKLDNHKGINDEVIALNESALRSFYADAIGPEAPAEKVAA